MQRIRTYKVNLKSLVRYVLVSVISCTLTVAVFRADLPPRSKDAPYYAYGKLRASNGVLMHAVKTTPRHIGLKAVESNLAQLADRGINGGFFWEGYLLSIAVINDKPVRDQVGDYGSGWYNTDRKKGTLVWDSAAERFSVQVVEDAKDLAVTDRSRYWAQGGVSMNLQDDAGWAAQAMAEDMPAMDEPRMRSGIVYDTENNVWLLVSPGVCTVEQFRSAIKERIGPAKAVNGVFLDGDGSSQLNLARVTLPGDNREVYQMVTLIP